MTSEYYLNPVGTPHLFESEKDAETILRLEKTVYHSLIDAELFVTVELPQDEVEKLTNVTLKKGVFK